MLAAQALAPNVDPGKPGAGTGRGARLWSKSHARRRVEIAANNGHNQASPAALPS